MAPGEKISIVIADDHAVLRESLATLLSAERDFEVVGAASNGEQAVVLLQERKPDVLVLDLFMPDGDGFDVLRQIERAGIRVASVVLTGSENQADYVQVVRLGARGLVLKSDGPEKLFQAIRTVADGELAFGDEVAQGILSAMVNEGQEERATNLDRLSERERQIALLVARGMKNKDIAAELKISENTVKRHLQSVFSKTGTKDRLELAVLALSEISSAA
ncbi:MAG TPA: response regulator transcription factor [Clostridia bacterium]|nr:response regulator transcription factor [Clostridia bacterium]